MSFSGCLTLISADEVVPSAKVTVIDLASSTTWRLVRMLPWRSTMTPVPRPPCDGLAPGSGLGASALGAPPVSRSVWMSTSDGRMAS